MSPKRASVYYHHQGCLDIVMATDNRNETGRERESPYSVASVGQLQFMVNVSSDDDDDEDV